MLNKPVTIEIGEKTLDISLADILKHIYFRTPGIIQNIEIIGGFVRKTLLESPAFLLELLKSLTNLPTEKLQPYVDIVVKTSQSRRLPDIDIRVASSIVNRDILCNFTQSIVDYFAYSTQSPAHYVQRNAFSKFNVVYDDKNKFSIATVNPRDSFEYELLFVAQLKRKHLFAHDSLRLSILPFLLDAGPLALESDYPTPWQPLIDLLTRVIHVPDPETVDIFGFPVLMSYFTRGFSSGNPSDISRLEAKVTQLSQYHVGIPGQIAGLLSTTVRNHHQNNNEAAIALTINACMHLSISPLDTAALWDQMRAKYWADRNLENHYLLKAVDQAICTYKTPFSVVTAAVALCRGQHHRHDTSLQIEGTPYFLEVPIENERAIDTLANYLLENPDCNWLSPFLFGINNRDPHFFEPGSQLICSKSRAQRLLGYMLLLHTDNRTSDSKLLENFIDILNFLPENQRPRLFSLLESIDTFKSLTEEFKQAYTPGLSEQRQMARWIKVLVKHRATSSIANTLWIRYRSKFSKKSQDRMDPVLLEGLLPHDLEKALRIIELSTLNSKDFESKTALAMLANALPYITQLEESCFSVIAPRAIDAIIGPLASGRTLVPSHFPEVLSAFIHRLTDIGNDQQAEELLDLAAKHSDIASNNPYLYRARLSLLEKMTSSPVLLQKKWKTLEELGECPSEHRPLHKKIHLALTQQLLDNPETAQDGFRHLRVLANLSDPDPSLSQLAKRDVRKIVDFGDPDTAEQLIRKVYRKHFTPKTLISLRKRLFHRFLREMDIPKAFQQWKEIHSAFPETTRPMISALIKVDSNEKYLNAALRLLRKEVGDKEVSPKEKLDYFIEIYTKKNSLKLLGNIVTYCMETPACHHSSPRVIQLFVAEIKKQHIFDEQFLDVIRSQTPELIRQLKHCDDHGLVEKMIKAFNKLNLPFSDFELVKTQATSYLAQNNHAKALVWIKKAAVYEELFSSWLPELLQKYRVMTPEQEAETLLTYHPCILTLTQLAEINERACLLAENPEVPIAVAIQLFDLYRPITSISWSKVIERCKPSEFPIFWKSFYSWLDSSPEPSQHLRQTVQTASQFFSQLDTSTIKSLYTSLNSPDSPLGRLCESDAQTLELRGQLLLAYTPLVKSPADLTHLYDFVGNGFDLSEHLPAYRDLTLKMIEALILRKDNRFTITACQIFSLMTNMLLIAEDPPYSEPVSYALLSLLDIVRSHSYLYESDTMTLLVHASFVLRGNFANQIPSLDLAEKLSAFKTPLALEECLEHLSLLQEETPRSQKTWGVYLSNWLTANYCLDNPADVSKALTDYSTHIPRLAYKSKDYITCSDIAFDLILTYLDSPATMGKFCELTESYFKTLFGDRTVLATEREMPLYPYFSPIFTCNDTCDPEDSAFFFERMTTFVSKILDRKSLEASEESYIHHFLTKNLWALCTRFPQRKEILIPILDRFYFRYPPMDNMFFPAHVSFAGQLLLHAIRQGIYDSHEAEMAEAMLFLEMKTCLLEGNRTEDQEHVLEKVIDRVLAFRTPSALIRAVLILQGTQAIIIKNNLPAIQRIYGKLTEAVMIDPFYIYERSTLFEWVRLGLMHKETIIGFSGDEQALSSVTTLSENLFLKVLGIFQSPKLFQNSPTFSRTALLEWLGKFLILSRQNGAFWDQEGVNRYFLLAEKIVPEVIKLYADMSPSQQKHLSEIYTRIIIGEGFERTNKMSKKQKRSRSELMKKWLLKIICTPEHCRAQLEIAHGLKVFDGNNKDYKKIDSKLKSLT